jgi:trimeric autotransporter adhesin
MSLAKTLLTALVALSLAATVSAKIRSATITDAVTDQSGAVAANAEVVLTNSGTNVSYKTQTTEAGMCRMPYLEAGTCTVRATVKVTAQAAQIHAGSSAVTNATDAQVINDVPNVTQNPLFYAMLQNGVQPRSETSTRTFRRSINDRQSISAS